MTVARCTFRIWEQDGWRVSRDSRPYGEFLTRGDAVRAACFGARTAASQGIAAEVLTPPGTPSISHYEPHFGE